MAFEDHTPCPYQLWNWIFTRSVFGESSWERRLWRESDNGQGEGGQYKLIELFLQYGAGEDLCLMFGPCFEVTGANRLIVQARVCESSGIPIPLFCLKGVCIDYELDIVRYARTRRGRLNFRDVLTYCFPRNYHHLYALLDGKSPASGGAVETGISYSDDMLVVFPTESRYFEDDDSGRSLDSAIEGKRPPKHSKKCFTDFEAKFKDERSGRPCKLKLPSPYDDED